MLGVLRRFTLEFRARPEDMTIRRLACQVDDKMTNVGANLIKQERLRTFWKGILEGNKVQLCFRVLDSPCHGVL